MARGLLRLLAACSLVPVLSVLLSPSPVKTSSLQRLPWNPQGYKEWVWRGHRINYVDAGEGQEKPALLLIHGFGASVYHCEHFTPLDRDLHLNRAIQHPSSVGEVPRLCPRPPRLRTQR